MRNSWRRFLLTPPSLAVLLWWFVLMLPGMTGCTAERQSPTQALVDRLEKAQTGVPPLAQAVGSLTAERQKEEMEVKAILDRWIEAQGEGRRLIRLKNVHCLTRLVEGPNRYFYRTVEAADGRYRFDLVGGSCAVCGGYDGQRGWQDNGDWGTGVFPARRGDPYWCTRCLKAVQLDKYYPTRRLLPDDTVDGIACAVLGMTSANGREERWLFDRRSGLLSRVAVKIFSGQEETVTYSDYRSVSRIMIPYVITISNPRQENLVYSLVRVEFNSPIADVDFSPSAEFLQRAAMVDELLRQSVENGWSAEHGAKASVAHATIVSTTNGVKTQVKIYRRHPGFVLVEKESAGVGRTVSGYDGTVGWENSEILGYHLLKESEVNNLFSLSWLGTDPYLREHFPLRVLLHDTVINDRPAYAVRLRSFSGQDGVFYFDKENARMLRIEMNENPAAHVQAQKVDYGDYRVVGGITMPFRVSAECGGAQTVITCDAVEMGVDLADSFFRPRTETE